MIKATSLSNIEVGGKWNNIVSLRFKAATSAPLSAVRLYWVIGNPPGKQGYMAGNGGAFSYSLASDVNGIPGPILAVAIPEIKQITQNGRGNFPLVCFAPILLTAGQFYHIVVQNTDLSPDVNWASLDFLVNDTVLDQTPDLQVLISQVGASWKPFPKFMGSPVGLFYADGTVQGYGYYQVGQGGTLLAGVPYGYPKSICP